MTSKQEKTMYFNITLQGTYMLYLYVHITRHINALPIDLYAIYSEAKEPKGMVQIIHGMSEHKERYIPFIQRLNDNGYTVIISDNRGHGKSVSKEYPYGHIESYDVMVSDQYMVTKWIKEKNPKLDLYMFAHSMGSVIARNYLMTHDNEIKTL